jgi:sugar-specific transcriptional regulator TrmB
MIEQVLEEIGLTKNEIKVYLTLLELGESKSGEVLKKSELNSGRIYEIFNSLQKKGFISIVIKSGVKYFSPADPKKILDYLEEKKDDITKKEEDFKTILPDLLSKIELNSPETKIEIFLGLKGIKTAYQKELDYTKETGFVNIMGVGSREYYSKSVYDFFAFNQQPKRTELGIKIRKVIDISSKSRKKDEHESNANIRYFDFISPGVSYLITKGLVIIGIHNNEKDSISIVIESENVSKSFIQQFEVLWKISKK